MGKEVNAGRGNLTIYTHMKREGPPSLLASPLAGIKFFSDLSSHLRETEGGVS
jgi:hypothetical protein